MYLNCRNFRFLLIVIAGSAMPCFAQFGIGNLAGIRPIGMGDAFTAVADDENALYYNPAALACLKGKYGTFLLNTTVQGDVDSYQTYEFLIKDRFKYEKTLDGIELKNDRYQNDLKRLAGRPAEVTVINRLIESAVPNFGFGLIVRQYFAHELAKTEQKDMLYFNNQASVTGIIGYSKTLANAGDHFLHYGMSMYYTFNKTYPASKLIDTGIAFQHYFQKPNAKQIYQNMITNQSLGITLGLLFEKRNWGLRSGLVIRDFMVAADQKPTTRSYYWGLAFMPTEIIDLSAIRNLVLSIDYDDFANSARKAKDKFQFGTEIGIPMISLRTGYAYQDWFYGVRLKLAFIHLDVAYSENAILPYGASGQKLYYMEARIGW